MKFKLPSLTMTIFILTVLSSVDSKKAEPSLIESQRYTDNMDGTITDSKTGLMWMKNDSYLHSGHWLNWYEAKAFIKKLNEKGFANYFDWQYPTTRELKTLFNADKLNSAQMGREMKIHTDPLFGKKGSGSLWSADENGMYNAFGVEFNTGNVFSVNKKSRSRKATRAVRKHFDN